METTAASNTLKSRALVAMDAVEIKVKTLKKAQS